MPQGNGNGTPRLDSWKEIAAYLHRNVATVRRWEKTLGLPVRRVPGSRGHTVFAYTAEIDAWLGARERNEISPVATFRRRVDVRWIAASVLLLVMTAVGWRVLDARVSPDALRVDVTPDAVIAYDTAGRERWRSAFPSAFSTGISELGDASFVIAGERPGVLAGYTHRVRRADNVAESGALLQFDLRGHLERSFSFADEVTVGGKTIGPPWGLNAFAVDDRDGRRRVAVAGHHFVWAPSLVTVLDDDWRRVGTFVHDGWIENVRWLTADRLLVGGFSEPHNAGMVAVVDPNALDRGPLRVVVMPRSEINRVTGSRFNRALVQVMPDRILVRAIEVPSTGMEGVDALYEFSRTEHLALLRASFSARYWDTHRVLELEGKIDHSRVQCPDRDGPRMVHVRDPEGGWTKEHIRLGRSTTPPAP